MVGVEAAAPRQLAQVQAGEALDLAQQAPPGIELQQVVALRQHEVQRQQDGRVAAR